MLKKVRKRRDDALSRISWQSFETLLAAHYRTHGYRVDHVGSGNGMSRYDGGIDLELHRDDDFVLVQCKHWNARQVPHNAVHELLGVMVNRGATAAVVVCSGEFTKAVRDAARLHGHVQLVDGNALRGMLGPLTELSLEDNTFAVREPTRRSRGFADELRERAPRREWSQPRAGVRLLAAAFSVAVMIAATLAILGGVRDFQQALTRPPAAPAAAAARPVAQGHAAPALPSHVSEPVSAARSRTPTSSVEPAMRGAQLLAWRRRNAASMKILDKTTPQME